MPSRVAHLGKAAQKDAEAGKATFVSALGVDGARREARQVTDRALSRLDTFGARADELRASAAIVPDDRLLVTESGIHSREDVQRMRNSGVHAFLVGEAFMTAPDPGEKLAELFALES